MISLGSLGIRDGWTCHICQGEVQRGPGSNEADSPTIDHIIPVSKGGLHEWSNVALAHKGCNSSKKDRWPLAA